MSDKKLSLGAWSTTQCMVDERGRLTIADEHRSTTGSEAIFTAGPNGCVRIYHPEVWQALRDKFVTGAQSGVDRYLSALPPPLDMFIGYAQFAPIDKDGRCLLAPHLRDYADLNAGNQAVVSGFGDYVQVWNRARWVSRATQDLTLPNGQSLLQAAHQHLERLAAEDLPATAVVPGTIRATVVP